MINPNIARNINNSIISQYHTIQERNELLLNIRSTVQILRSQIVQLLLLWYKYVYVHLQVEEDRVNTQDMIQSSQINQLDIQINQTENIYQDNNCIQKFNRLSQLSYLIQNTYETLYDLQQLYNILINVPLVYSPTVLYTLQKPKQLFISNSIFISTCIHLHNTSKVKLYNSLLDYKPMDLVLATPLIEDTTNIEGSTNFNTITNYKNNVHNSHTSHLIQQCQLIQDNISQDITCLYYITQNNELIQHSKNLLYNQQSNQSYIGLLFVISTMPLYTFVQFSWHTTVYNFTVKNIIDTISCYILQQRIIPKYPLDIKRHITSPLVCIINTSKYVYFLLTYIYNYYIYKYVTQWNSQWDYFS